MGGGAVLIIYLTVFEQTPQLEAQGINLLFFVPIAALALAVYTIKKKIKWKSVLPLALGGAVGAVGGIFLTELIGGSLLSKFFGAFLVLLGLKEIFAKSKKNS